MLAWKELKHDRKKYVLVELILILMIFMVLFLSGLVSGLGRAVSSGIDNMQADYFWLSDDSENLITVSDLTPETIEEMQTLVDGESSALDILRVYIVTEPGGEKTDLTYFAMDPDSFLMPEINEGEAITGDNQIVLNDSYKEDGISVGDVIYDATTEIPLTVVGFTTDTMYAHIAVGVISTDTYTAIRTEMNEYYEESVHALAVRGSVTGEVDGTVLVSKEDIISDLPGYQSEQLTIGMVLWVMVILSAAILGVFFYVLTIQKEKQFGILKAIGVSMRELTGNLMAQMLILSVCGSIVGNILAFSMASALPASMPFYLTVKNAAVVTIAFLAASLLGSLFSVVKVARVDPLISIGGNA